MNALTHLSLLGLLLALLLAAGPRPEADYRSVQKHTSQKHGFSDYAVAW